MFIDLTLYHPSTVEPIDCDALRDLVPFVPFKKHEKHLWRSVTFSTKINTPAWVFLTFSKLYKWYQIAQRTTIIWQVWISDWFFQYGQRAIDRINNTWKMLVYRWQRTKKCWDSLCHYLILMVASGKGNNTFPSRLWGKVVTLRHSLVIRSIWNAGGGDYLIVLLKTEDQLEITSWEVKNIQNITDIKILWCIIKWIFLSFKCWRNKSTAFFQKKKQQQHWFFLFSVI